MPNHNPSKPPAAAAAAATSRPRHGHHGHRSIRADFDLETITVYQAYNAPIATAAVSSQCLSASPLFRTGRTTWIKPSWAWMMYRSGYGTKDPNQSRVLALKMRHADFAALLARTRSSGSHAAERESGQVVVQWDPERDVRSLERLDAQRSIQIGIPGPMVPGWTKEKIVEIIDVTDKAQNLKRMVDERPDVTVEELVGMGLVPVEREYDHMLPREVRRGLGMDVDDEQC